MKRTASTKRPEIEDSLTTSKHRAKRASYPDSARSPSICLLHWGTGPFPKSLVPFELGGGPFSIRAREMVWLYPDRMHVRRRAKHFSDLKLYKAVLKTGDREGSAQT